MEGAELTHEMIPAVVQEEDEVTDDESDANESTHGSQFDSDEESLTEEQIPAFDKPLEGDLPTEYGYTDDDDSVDYSDYLQKIDHSMKEQILETAHCEEYHINHDEMSKLCITKRNEHGLIVDPLHKTSPIMSKYESTKIIGLRCKQLGEGAQPLIKIPGDVMNHVVIAELELHQKVLPFVIKRPLPHGGCEYWRVKDLELLS